MIALRTLQMQIASSDAMFSYFQSMCHLSKNLYNEANFLIRQCFSGLSKPVGIRQTNEVNVIQSINEAVGKINQIRIGRSNANLFEDLDENNSFPGKYLLDGFLKLNKQVDYVALPAQANQNTLSLLYRDWKSFFEAKKDYAIHPDKYKGEPKPPRYCKKDGFKPCILTNQISKIKEDKKGYYIKFPKTKDRYYLGKLDFSDKKMKEIRMIPKGNRIVLELVYETQIQEAKCEVENAKRIMGCDIGLNNLCAMCSNTGETPILLKGRSSKSMNQYYNKQVAHYTSILRKGKKEREEPFTSNRLQRLHAKHANQVKDLLHKVSRKVVDICLEQDIEVFVIGKNKNWKQDINLGKVNNQKFVQLPFARLIDMITYKLQVVGIQVVLQEESYTSKASSLDYDEIPVYGKVKNPTFSGKRIKRGLYQSKDGRLINADVNGAINIMRKAYPSNPNCKGWISRAVDAPTVYSIV